MKLVKRLRLIEIIVMWSTFFMLALFSIILILSLNTLISFSNFRIWAYFFAYTGIAIFALGLYRYIYSYSGYKKDVYYYEEPRLIKRIVFYSSVALWVFDLIVFLYIVN